MNRCARRIDPLQVRTSRVKKSRRTQRNQRAFPPWFFRVKTISFKGNREVYGSDFDEDLSEPGEDEERERTEDCECSDENSECDCELEDGDDESERSYDGSDAECYYELKDQREGRKHEILQERKEKERVPGTEEAQGTVASLGS